MNRNLIDKVITFLAIVLYMGIGALLGLIFAFSWLVTL